MHSFKLRKKYEFHFIAMLFNSVRQIDNDLNITFLGLQLTGVIFFCTYWVSKIYKKQFNVIKLFTNYSKELLHFTNSYCIFWRLFNKSYLNGMKKIVYQMGDNHPPFSFSLCFFWWYWILGKLFKSSISAVLKLFFRVAKIATCHNYAIPRYMNIFIHVYL